MQAAINELNRALCEIEDQKEKTRSELELAKAAVVLNERALVNLDKKAAEISAAIKSLNPKAH